MNNSNGDDIRLEHFFSDRLLVLQLQFIWKGDFREQLEPDNVLP